MASSKVMTSRSPPNPDPPRHPSPPPLNPEQSRGLGSMSMEDILRNIYSDSDPFSGDPSAGPPPPPPPTSDGGAGRKTVEEVWRDIVSGGGGGGGGQAGMTLEDFLAKAGAVNEEDVRVPATAGGFGMEAAAMMGNPATVGYGGFGMEYGNGMVVGMGVGGGGGRGKRRAAVEEVPMDKATQQKQRRMIKNRESAARSRERKQAYTVELESLVTQLEEDNARLLKEEAELRKERYKQLMENLIPVVEKRRPPRVLRRTHSMEW